jgi:hypothetical protein
MVCGECYDSPAQLALHCDEEDHGPWNKKHTEPDEEDMEDAHEHEEARVAKHLQLENDILELTSESNAEGRAAKAKKAAAKYTEEDGTDESSDTTCLLGPPSVLPDEADMPPVTFQDVTSAVDVDRVKTQLIEVRRLETERVTLEKKDKQLADCCPKVAKRQLERELILGEDAEEKQKAHNPLCHIAQYGMQADGTWEVPDALPTQADFSDYFRKSELEIVVIVEGVDPVTANTVQKRHSYTVDDIVWGMRPAQCVFRSQLNAAGDMELNGKASAPDRPLMHFPSFRSSVEGEEAGDKMGCVVDYSKFHLLEVDDSPDDVFFPVQSR